MVASSVQPWLLLILLLQAVVTLTAAPAPVFDENYVAAWGGDGHHFVNQGTEISLTLDKISGIDTFIIVLLPLVHNYMYVCT